MGPDLKLPEAKARMPESDKENVICKNPKDSDPNENVIKVTKPEAIQDEQERILTEMFRKLKTFDPNMTVDKDGIKMTKYLPLHELPLIRFNGQVISIRKKQVREHNLLTQLCAPEYIVCQTGLLGK